MKQPPRPRNVLILAAALLLPVLLVAGLARAAGQAGSASTPVYRWLASYGYDEQEGREYIRLVDSANGLANPVADLNLEWAGVDQFAVDLSSGIAYLGGRAPGETDWRLYAIDLQDGSVVSSTLLERGLGAFGFASSGPGTLAAFDFVPDPKEDGALQGRILSLDPSSGETNLIAELDVDWVGVGMFAVDTTNQAAYLGGRKQGEDFWRLYAIDLQTRDVNSTLLDTGEGGFGFTAYSPGQLLAYTYEGGQGLIVSLDPASGVTSTLATFPLDFSGVGQFVADPDHQMAYLGALPPGESAWRLYVADLSSGDVYSSTLLDKGDGGFGFNAYLVARHVYLPLVVNSAGDDD